MAYPYGHTYPYGTRAHEGTTSGGATSGGNTCSGAAFGAGMRGAAVFGGATFGRGTFGRATFGRATFGRATSGRATSGRATSGRATSGRATSGRATSGRVHVVPAKQWSAAFVWLCPYVQRTRHRHPRGHTYWFKTYITTKPQSATCGWPLLRGPALPDLSRLNLMQMGGSTSRSLPYRRLRPGNLRRARARHPLPAVRGTDRRFYPVAICLIGDSPSPIKRGRRRESGAP